MRWSRNAAVVNQLAVDRDLAGVVHRIDDAQCVPDAEAHPQLVGSNDSGRQDRDSRAIA